MEVTAHPDAQGTSPGRDGITRRGFLYASGGAGSALFLGTRTGSRSARRARRDDRDDMILQVTRTVAVFPVTFPLLAKKGGAASMATAARLSTAAASLTPTRLALARQGADQLIASGLQGQEPVRFVQGLADQAGSAAAQPGLGSLVALAIATLSDRFRPSADLIAQAWLDGLRGLRRRGTLAQAAVHLEAR
jgi:hypothetical protein